MVWIFDDFLCATLLQLIVIALDQFDQLDASFDWQLIQILLIAVPLFNAIFTGWFLNGPRQTLSQVKHGRQGVSLI